MDRKKNPKDDLSPETLKYFERIWLQDSSKLQTEKTRRIIELLMSKEEVSALYSTYLFDHFSQYDKSQLRRTIRRIKWYLEDAYLAEGKEKAAGPRPPFNAEFLLYLLLRKEERDVVIGDLIETYGKIAVRFNKRRADIWFYKQVGCSIFPLLRRQVLRIGAIVWLGRILQRLIS